MKRRFQSVVGQPKGSRKTLIKLHAFAFVRASTLPLVAASLRF